MSTIELMFVFVSSKTTYYNLRPDISADYHVRMDSACSGGDAECTRDFHLYKVIELQYLYYQKWF